jgi:predicted O-methyltransferase YrrM
MRGEEVPHEPLPESRFVPADERCPHPEFWSSTDGDSTELEVSELIAGLVRGLQPRMVIETGCAFGQTTRLIIEAMGRNGHGRFVGFENDSERFVALHSERWPEWAALYRNSLGGIQPLPDVIDFLFLDSHPELRVPEYRHFHPLMRHGTIVAIHDTRPGAGSHRIEGGRSLREELESLPDVRLLDMPTPRGLTLAQVL